MHQSTVRAVGVALLLLFGVACADAQTSYPMVMSLKPVAVQVGTVSECEVHSRYTMLGAHQVLVSGEGVTAEVIPPTVETPKPGEKPKELTKLKLKITVDSTALPGVREFRLATPNGASTLGQLVVVRDPVIVESADNNSAEKAQEVALPAALCGTIEKAEDFDFFKFHAEAGQSFVFHVRAQRLQDKIHDLQTHVDPILFIRDAQGSVVAMSDNALYADPFLSHAFAKSGDYFLEIRDVRYQGNVYWEYCVEVSSRPFVLQVSPMAVAPGVETTVDLAGALLPPDAKGLVTTAATARGLVQSPVLLNGEATNAVSLWATDLPLITEAAEDNDALDKSPQTITPPAAINGRIEKSSDLDVYAFEAKKGDLLTFEVLARRYGSNLDSYLRLLNEKGQALKEEDDSRDGKLTFADARIDGWSVPADGKYFVEVRDVHLRGGAGYNYVLTITRSTPSFELILDTDKTNLSPGMHGVLFVRATRKHGFAGPIDLQVDGLPEGVTATCGRILPGKSEDGAIVLCASPEAKPVMGRISVRGIAHHQQAEGQPPLELVVQATPYQETYAPGGGRIHYASNDHVVCVGGPADILSMELSTTDVALKPGESREIQVKLKRNADVKANITLDFLFRHLNSKFADTLPEGVTIDTGKSKTLLSNGASEGVITLKADAKAPPAEKQVCSLMANFSLNFVMKATYSSPPVFVTVLKAE